MSSKVAAHNSVAIYLCDSYFEIKRKSILFNSNQNKLCLLIIARGATDSFFTDFLGCRKPRKREEKQEKFSGKMINLPNFF